MVVAQEKKKGHRRFRVQRPSPDRVGCFRKKEAFGPVLKVWSSFFVLYFYLRHLNSGACMTP
jgi:hypothetical protein